MPSFLKHTSGRRRERDRQRGVCRLLAAFPELPRPAFRGTASRVTLVWRLALCGKVLSCGLEARLTDPGLECDKTRPDARRRPS